jgi:hypothetical protein
VLLRWMIDVDMFYHKKCALVAQCFHSAAQQMTAHPPARRDLYTKSRTLQDPRITPSFFWSRVRLVQLVRAPDPRAYHSPTRLVAAQDIEYLRQSQSKLRWQFLLPLVTFIALNWGIVRAAARPSRRLAWSPHARLRYSSGWEWASTRPICSSPSTLATWCACTRNAAWAGANSAHCAARRGSTVGSPPIACACAGTRPLAR